jgi:hypothetical protein
MIKKSFFFSLFVVLCLCSYSQIKYGIAFSGGVSNIIISDKDPISLFGNYFEPSSMVSVDGLFLERNPNSRISFEQGISLETLSSECGIPEKDYEEMKAEILGFNQPRTFTVNSYQLAVPLRVRYDFEKWLVFHAGVSNAFYLIPSKKSANIINRLYSLRGEAGADFIIAKKFLTGIKYSQDFTPCGQFSTDKIYFHSQSLSLRLGLLLN